jgi:hypothetical protein
MRLRFSSLLAGAAMAVSLHAYATPPSKSQTINPAPNQMRPSAGPVSSGNHPIKIDSNAGKSETASVISVDGLATVTAIFLYCEQVDRKNEDFYENFLKMMLAGHASSEIKMNESSASYGASVRLINQRLAALPRNTMVSSCKSVVP